MTTPVPSVETTAVDDAAAVFSQLPSDTIGWFLSPGTAQWFRVSENALDVADPSLAEDAYEVQAFQHDSSGTRAWSWYRPLGAPGALTCYVWPGPPTDVADAWMLLKGHVVAFEEGWATLHGQDATSFRIPMEASPGSIAVVAVHEVRTEDELGNVRVGATVPVALDIRKEKD